MTKSRLPETDLARIAPLPTEDKWRLLRNMRAGFSPISYRPARRHLADALRLQKPLPFDIDSPSAAQLLAAVRADSRSDVEADANIEVIELIMDFRINEKITATAEDFAPLKLAPGYSATYWTNAILRWGDRLLVVNTDFRRGAGYSPLGRRFSISVAHQRIRMMGGDYAELELGLLTFPGRKHQPRSIQLSVPQVELFSYEELVEMTGETLAIWDQVCEEKAASSRRRAANDDGPLFSEHLFGGVG
ncbi:hypothetical protein [Caulobacter sp. RL271]|uniref:Uncharacterized protein n=1 Tax=Caulobacter segnis TaxID=88688 RepID=A0ABY4ZV15_9CAUL|nr:hypothetical protein [Caulobacter segnis]USQ96515.1 hypothetical protein MZV50_02670 [Caulobacter segnis]